MSDLKLERMDQANRTFQAGVLALAPMVTPDYWSYRVRLTDDQAIVGFPKFNTIGIGFQREDEDWNTNFPYTVDAEKIADHIWENHGPSLTDDDKPRVVEAIEIIQLSIREAVAS